MSPLSAHLLQYFGPNNNPTGNHNPSVPANPQCLRSIMGSAKSITTPPTTTRSLLATSTVAATRPAAMTRITRCSSFDSIGKMRAEFLTTSWTWTPNSTWVNDVRFGWNHYLRNTQTGDYLTPASTYGLNTGVTDPQLLRISPRHHRQFRLARPVAVPSRRETSAQGTITMSWITFPGLHGKHAFKFGGEILYLRTFFDQIPNGRGTFTFTGGTNVIPNGTAY